MLEENDPSIENDIESVIEESFESQIIEEASVISNYYQSFEVDELDPYAQLKRVSNSFSDRFNDGEGREGRLRTPINSSWYDNRSYIQYQGDRLAGQAETYNKYQDRINLAASVSNVANTIIRDYQVPQGFTPRPTDKDYNFFINKQLGEKGSGMRAAFFQFQSREIVSNLITKKKSGSTIEIVTQAMSDNSSNKGAALLSGNEVTARAMGDDSVFLVKMESEGDKSPSFHPKIAYFTNKTKGDKDKVTGLMFGTQNITPALANNNTLEEVFFIDVSNVNTEKGKSIVEEFKTTVDTILDVAKENRATLSLNLSNLRDYIIDAHTKDIDDELDKKNRLTRIDEFMSNVYNTLKGKKDGVNPDIISNLAYKDIEDTLLLLLGTEDDPVDEISSLTRLYLEKQKESNLIKEYTAITRKSLEGRIPNAKRENILLNREIQEKITLLTDAAATTNKKQKVILNLQYLERLFLPTTVDPSKVDKDFSNYRLKLMTAIKTLADSNRLTIVTSETSFDAGQGLFNLISRMNEVKESNLSDADKIAYQAYQSVVKNGSFSTQPVQYMHSKVLALTDIKGREINEVLMMTANASFQAYTENIELGFLTNKEDRAALGLEAQEAALNKYYMDTLKGEINKGLFVERRGKASAVSKTIDLLKQIGGVETGKEGADSAKFTFSERFTQIDTEKGKDYKLSGLDIKIKGQRTISITVDSVNTSYLDENGLSIQKETPIIYLNKGNRIIAGAGYKYSGTKPLSIASLDTTLMPGDSLRLDANQVLAGLIQTLSLGYEYEKDGRSLLLALTYLDQKVGIDKAMSRLAKVEGKDKLQGQAKVESDTQIDRLTTILKGIIASQNSVEIRQYADLAKSLIATSKEAGEFYRDTLRESNKLMFNQVTDVFPQPHKLPYSAEQALYNLPIMGADDANLELLLAGYSDEAKLQGVILSQIDLRHEDQLKMAGRAAIRGVSSVSRPVSLSPIEMIGGLHKSRESAPKAIDANFMNTQPGMRMFSAQEYKSKLAKALESKITDPKEKKELIDKITRTTFDIYHQKELKDINEEETPDNAVLMYFPFPKTEQISQRLKNTLSIRPFNYTSDKLKNYMRGAGLITNSAITDIDWNSPSDKIRATILSALPDSQYKELKRRLDAAPDTKSKQLVIDSILRDSLNPDAPSQGYTGEERTYMASVGASQQSDFAYINSALTRDGGYLYQHRSQTAISSKETQGDISSYISNIKDRLKVGTLFLATKLKVEKTGDTSALYDLIKDKVAGRIENGITTQTTPGELKLAIRQASETEPWIDKAFDITLNNGELEIYLKKGVYKPTESEGVKGIEKIGDLDEATGKFYINDIYRSKSTSSDKKLGRLYIGAPAFPRRATKGISVLSNISIGNVDNQPGIFTLNTEFLTDTALDSGMRGSTVKGPMLMLQQAFFSRVASIYTGNEINGQDIFGVMGASQMKGFIFSSGFALLRKQGELINNQLTYKPLKEADAGQRVVEALSLMFIDNQEVRESLLSMYESNDTLKESRSEISRTLRILKGTKKIKEKVNDGSIDKAYSPTLGVYEGFVGLISSANLERITQEDISVERALVDTIKEAATNEDARKELLASAQRLIADTEALQLPDNQFTFNETQERPAALIAHYMEASLALFSNRRQIDDTGSLSELGYIKGPTDYNSNTLQTFYQGRINSVFVNESTSEKTKKIKRVNELLSTVSTKDEYRSLLRDNEELRVLAGSVDRYATDQSYANRFYKAGKGAGVYLPEYSEITPEMEDQIENQLYSISAIGNANRYIQFITDAAINRITPPVGMQDSTDLEGHYAAEMTKRQLKLYTDSAKSLENYTGIQSAVITLGTMVDAQAGYIGSDANRSSYRLQASNVIELSDQLNFTGIIADEAIATAENLRAQALRFSTDFGQAYFTSADKSLPKILGDKDRPGIMSIPIGYSVFNDFLKSSGEEGDESTTQYKSQLKYMEYIKAITGEVARDTSESLIKNKIDLLVEDYLTRVTNDNGDLKSQAEYLVREVEHLLKADGVNSLARDQRVIDVIATATKSGADPESITASLQKLITDQSLPYLITKSTEGTAKITDGKDEIGITKFVERVKIYSNYAALSSLANSADTDKLQKLTALSEKIASYGYEERKELLRLSLFTINRKSSEAKATLKGIVQAGITETEPSSDKLIAFSLLKAIVGKEFKDKIDSSINDDAGKEYLLGRQLLYRYAKERLERDNTTAGQKIKLNSIITSIGNTQAIEIPSLEYYAEYDAAKGYTIKGADREGNYRMTVTAQRQEQGWLLGLDLLENVALIFPDFSSQALNAQYELTESMRMARESGVLDKIATWLPDRTGSLMLNEAEIESYERLRRAAAKSRTTALELIGNAKTIRNALGDQLSMKGASYIAMSSFLLDEDQIVLGDRFDSVLKAGEAQVGNTLQTMITDVTNPDIAKDIRIASARNLNELGQLLNPNYVGIQTTDDKELADILKSRFDSREANTVLGITDDKSLEKALFMSNILFGRQGAPSGSGPGFPVGAKAIGIADYNQKVLEAGSLMQLDEQMNRTTMLLSMLGPQFTQLGDYDGDSFQAATTRMAEITAAYKRSRDDFNTATSLKAKITDNDEDLQGYLEYNINAPRASMLKAAKLMAENLQALNELQKTVKSSIGEKLRRYANELIGLPLSLFEGHGGSSVIKDIDIADLIKQSRDTASGLYDNQEKLLGWFPQALTNLETYTREGDLLEWSGDKVPTMLSEDPDKLSLFKELLKEYADSSQSSIISLVDKGNKKKEKEKEIIKFYAEQVQNYIALGTTGKQTEKLMGSLLSESSLREVQAVIGSTGTGLLGKSYNTIIPLLSMSSGATATLEAFRSNNPQVRARLTKSVKAIRAKDSEADGSFLDFLSSTYGSSQDSRILETESLSIRRQLQATTGLLLDVQQFLRDAALKPKEKGGIGQAASTFNLVGVEGFEWAEGITGLGNLLDSKEATPGQRSQIMDLFISHEVGSSLELSSIINGDSVVTKGTGIENQGLKAFSALHMMNEYLSGKYSASQMMERSIFSSTLKAYKGAKENEGLTDKQVVEQVLYGALTKFQANFAYDNVLEGDKYGEILSRFTDKMINQYDIQEAEKGIYTAKVDATNIDRRVGDYKTYLEEESRKVVGSGSIISNEQALEEARIIAAPAYDAEYQRRKNLIEEASRERAISIQLGTERQNQQLTESIQQEKVAIEAQIASIKDDISLRTLASSDPNIRPAIANYEDNLLKSILNIDDLAPEQRISELDQAIDNDESTLASSSNVSIDENNKRVIDLDPNKTLVASRLQKARLEKERLLRQQRNIAYLKRSFEGTTKLVADIQTPLQNISNIRENYRGNLEFELDVHTKELAPINLGAASTIQDKLDLLNEQRETLNSLEDSTARRKALRANTILSRFYTYEERAYTSATEGINAFNPDYASYREADENITRLTIAKTELDLQREERERQILESQRIENVNSQNLRDTQIANIPTGFTNIGELDNYINELRSLGSDEVSSPLSTLEEARNKYTALTTGSTTALSATIAPEEQERINNEVARFRQQEEKIQSVILESLNKPIDAKYVTSSARGQERAKNVFRSLIEYELSERNKFLIEQEGRGGAFDKLIAVNKMISSIKQSSEKIGINTDTLEVMNLAFFNLMRRGKADANVIAQVTSISQEMMERITSEAGSEERVNAYLNLGGVDLPAVQEEIDRLANQAKEDKIASLIKDKIAPTIKRRMGKAFDTQLLTRDTLQETINETEAEYIRASNQLKPPANQGLYSDAEETTRVTQQTNTPNIQVNKTPQTTTEEPIADDIREDIIKIHEEAEQVRIKTKQRLEKTYVDVMTYGDDEGSVIGQVAGFVSETATAASQAAQKSALQQQLGIAQQANDTTTAGIIEGMLAITDDTSDSARFSALSEGLKATENLIKGAKSDFNREVISNAINLNQKEAKKGYGFAGLMSLMVVPAIFTLAQGDVTMNDRVASMMTDVVTTAVTTASYEDSAIRKVIYGNEQDIVQEDINKADRAASILQRARIGMAMRSSHSQTEGLLRGVGFEAMMMTSGMIANKFAESITDSKGGGTAASVVAEVATGFILSGLAALVNKRTTPGTFINNTDEWAITYQMLKSITNNMLLVEQQIMNARTDEEYYLNDEYAGGGTDQLAASGFELPEDNTSMSVGERLLITMSNLEMSEELSVEDYV